MTGQDAVTRPWTSTSASASPASSSPNGRRRPRWRGDLHSPCHRTAHQFIGVGEKPDAFEPFHPTASSPHPRHGDMLSLIEKAESTSTAKIREFAKKARSATASRSKTSATS